MRQAVLLITVLTAVIGAVYANDEAAVGEEVRMVPADLLESTLAQEQMKHAGEQRKLIDDTYKTLEEMQGAIDILDKENQELDLRIKKVQRLLKPYAIALVLSLIINAVLLLILAGSRLKRLAIVQKIKKAMEKKREERRIDDEHRKLRQSKLDLFQPRPPMKI